MQSDLFDSEQLALSPHSVLFRRALTFSFAEIEATLSDILSAAPLRQFQTPSGNDFSVASSNCGALGWVSDRLGYRYQRTDPQTKQTWPAMPETWHTLARDLAARAGYTNFDPDCCLINRYTSCANMSLHQDRDEQDFSQPIVSFSLGADAVFLWGGLQRSDRADKLMLNHGDVLVWGGPDRLRFHGIQRILPSQQYPYRYNLTFRRAA